VSTTNPPTRGFRLTPGHCLLALPAVEFLLFLSQWFRWLPKGWPVLIAVASVGVVMLAMFVWFGVALMFRRRFQFSIRSLLVLVVVVALPCSWMAVEMKKANKQRRTAAEIGNVGYDWEFDASGNLLPNAQPSGPAWLRNAFGDDFFSHVDFVGFNAEQVTDAWFADLEEFPQLQGFMGTRVTDAGLEHLKGLTQLQWLNLTGTRVTDAGLKHLKGLGQLRLLDLENTQVTDAGGKKLQKALPNCQIAW